MNRKLGRKKIAALIGIPASLVITRAVWAQTTYQWTGSGLDQLWTDNSNWTPIGGAGTTFPVSGDTALFNTVSADGSNLVNLGNGTQGLLNLSFTNGAASYTIGVAASGDTLNFSQFGGIFMNNVANAQVINAAVNSSTGTSVNGLAFTISNTSSTSLTFNNNVTLNGATSLFGSSGATMTFNAPISGTSGLTLGTASQTQGTVTTNYALGTLNLNAHNTYSGGTLLNGPGTIIPITFSPSGSNSGFGVFGTGPITFNNGNNQHIRPIGNQVIYNTLTLTTGFTIESSSVGDTSSLTMAGPINLGSTGRFISNGFVSNNATLNGATLVLGLALSPNVLTMSNSSTNAQTLSLESATGPIIINDIIANSGTGQYNVSINPNTGGINYILFNGQSTYSGSTAIGGSFANMGAIGIGASSVMSGTAIVSGPFGTGKIVTNDSVTPGGALTPVGADRTVANPIFMSTGFFVASASASLDPTGAHSLTLSGPITEGNTGRFITNDMAPGTSLILGSATNPSTITLGNTTSRVNLSIQAQAAAGVGGGVTIINDVIQDGSGTTVTAGLLNLAATTAGTVYLNANNTWSGGLQFSSTGGPGMTAVVSSDANMGSATGSIIFTGGGTLLDTGTFSSSRTVNLANTSTSATSTLDVTAGNTLTLTGGIAGAGDLNKGTNAGTLQLTLPVGGTLTGNVNVNGGALVLGANSTFTNTPNGPVVNGGGLTSPVFVNGTLTITNGAKLAINPTVPGSGQTHSVGALNIGPNSVLDIGNHNVIVQNAPDETVIGGYLTHGYAGGFWNGTSASGGAINSIVAFNDNSGATSIGYGNSSDFTFGGSTSPYAVGGPKALSGNQVVVAPALAGDLLLSGTVGPNELALMLGSFGTTGNDWAFGNIDYDAAGLVGPNDLSLLLSNFGHSSAGFVGAKTSAKSLTSTAKPSLTASAADVAPPPADGIELIVNFQTGDVEIEGNNATLGTSIVLTSAANGLVGGTTFTPAFSALFNTSASNTNGLIDEFNTFTNGSAVNGLVDMGNIYNTIQNSGDIQFQFSEKGINRGGLQTGSVTYVGVPEPTTLSLLAVASAGLLGRRRRKAHRRD